MGFEFLDSDNVVDFNERLRAFQLKSERGFPEHEPVAGTDCRTIITAQTINSPADPFKNG